MQRRPWSRAAIVAVAVTAAATVITAPASGAAEPPALRDHGSGGHSGPAVYTLPGDPDEPGGSKFEGIGLDERRSVF